jgi:hypothetical protein
MLAYKAEEEGIAAAECGICDLKKHCKDVGAG